MATVFKDFLQTDEDSTEGFESRNNKKKYYRGKRKRRRKPFDFYSGRFTGNNIDLGGKKTPPFKEYKDFEDYDYEIDFYEDKNYEYIDQADVESTINQKYLTNHKIGDDFIDSKNRIFNYNYEPLDYSNYDYEEVGNLNFGGAHEKRGRYRRRRYKPKNKIYFSKRRLRNIFVK